MTRKVEVIIVTTIFIIVVGCFSIPIIIYATDSQDITTPREDVMTQVDISNCPQQVAIASYGSSYSYVNSGGSMNEETAI